jgi:cell division septation protein DedD
VLSALPLIPKQRTLNMIRKSVILPFAVVLVLMALYAVWHYSPLRYLTRSESQPDQVRAGALKSRSRPVIITKKILPDTEKLEQTTDLPRPLIVLKDLPINTTSRSAEQPVKSVDTADEKKKSPVLQPDGSLVAQKNGPLESKPDASDKTLQGKPQAASSKMDPHHPYSIILSSCRLPQSARKVVSDYQKVGLAPYIVKVKFENGDEWLRVLTGHYQNRQQALEVKKKHDLSDAIVKKTPYTSLIGTFSAKEEMNETLARLTELGYSPYTLKTPGGQYKLLVGAFITEEGAENQRQELQSKGIRNQVIDR